MTYRKEAAQPTYRWACATDTAREFKDHVRDTYGLECGPIDVRDANNPKQNAVFVVGSVTAKAYVGGTVNSGTQLLWCRDYMRCAYKATELEEADRDLASLFVRLPPQPVMLDPSPPAKQASQ